MQKRQKIVPNPAISAVSVARRTATPETPSERARILAATVAQQQRDDRIRTEAMKIMEPAPTLREDLTKNRRREIGAPMATLHQIPDPLAGIGWEGALELWSRISTPVMFAVWSIGCFALGRLS
jgi:hypothetical protein